MANVIITKPEQLAENLRMLLGNTFVAADHPDTVYLPNSVSMQSLARIPFYLCLVISALAGVAWFYTLIAELIKWSSHAEFRNEGVMITFIIFAFMSLMLFVSAWYLRRSKGCRNALPRERSDMACGLRRHTYWPTI